MHSRQPRLFIGSSSEGLNIAYGIQENLEFDAETTIWKQGIFKPTRQTLTDIVAAMRSTDFAAFVFNPDMGDFIWTGGKCHIYSSRHEQVELRLGRVPMAYPVIKAPVAV